MSPDQDAQSLSRTPDLDRNTMKRYILLPLGLILLVSFLFISFRKTPSEIAQMPLTSTSTGLALSASSASTIQSQANWYTFENTKYYYKIKHPESLQPRGGSGDGDGPYGEPLNKEEVVTVGGLRIATIGSDYVKLHKSLLTKVTAHKRLPPKNLEELAQEFRDVEATTTNIYNLTKKVSEVSEIKIDDTIAYEYNIRDGFAELILGFGGGSFGNQEMTIIVAKNPQSKNVFFISMPSADPLAKELLNSFRFIDNATAQIDLGGWKTYSNSKYSYSINYPPEGEGPKMATDELFTLKHTSTNEYPNVNIGTPKGKFGIIVMDSVMPKYSYDQPEGREELARVVTLDLSTFAKEVYDYNKSSEKAHSAQPLGPIVNTFKKETINDREAYSMNISRSTWFFATSIWQILIPGNGGSYTYTFLQNSKGQKFLLWYPANDPAFERMKRSFILHN